jgi:hypothetical protein
VVAFAVRSAVAAPLETLAEARTTADGRRLLGWGTIALTLLVCALIAWKLPMRRSLRDQREVWGIYPSYQGRYYAYSGVRERRNYASPHTYDARTVLSANGAASSDSARDIPRTRQIVDAKFGDIDASQEWEIGEPLRSAVGSIPLEPGPSRSHALSEAKPLAQEALATLAFLEQRRQLTAKELRQARAILRFLAAVEEEEAVYQGYQGPSANGSKAEATAKENGASRVGPQRIIRKRRQERPLPHNKRRGKSAATEVHSAEARRLLRKAVLRTRARKPRRSGRIKTTRRIAGVGGR